MSKSKNIFVCIGAIHQDYLLNFKKNIINYRTNPIIHKSRIGGVAYNVAELISIFEKIEFYSLSIDKELRSKISKNITINQIDKNSSNRYYIALSDKKNKFLLGLANTDEYEKTAASVTYTVASGVSAIIGYSNEERTDEGTSTKDQSGSAWYVGATVSF